MNVYINSIEKYINDKHLNMRYPSSSNFINLSNKEYGDLKVLYYMGMDRNHHAIYACRCSCGNIVPVSQTNLTRNHTTSCGCKLTKITTTHGMQHTRIYREYYNMLQRCYNPNKKHYDEYGGRGIKVCDEWLTSKNNKEHTGFLNFYKWSMENGYADTLSLDRIDVNDNYCPGNCRWVDMKIQAINKRNNVYVGIELKHDNDIISKYVFTINIWAEILEMPFNTLFNRIKTYGWNINDSIFTPSGGTIGIDRISHFFPYSCTNENWYMKWIKYVNKFNSPHMWDKCFHD